MTLKEKNIDVVLRYTDTGRIYGATFIDHDTHDVFNGSRLGKEFSANALEERFNHSQPPSIQSPIQPSNTEPIEGQSPISDTPSTQANENSQVHEESEEWDISMPGMDLFQTHGINRDEEEFARRMKRTKKKGRKL